MLPASSGKTVAADGVPLCDGSEDGVAVSTAVPRFFRENGQRWLIKVNRGGGDRRGFFTVVVAAVDPAEQTC